VICSPNTYSINPRESVCQRCPDDAICFGGDMIASQKGYYMISDLISSACLNEHACLGGSI
jgi:hypothetical protein